MPPNTALPLSLQAPSCAGWKPQRLAIWLVATQPLRPTFVLDAPSLTANLTCEVIPIGTQAFVHLLDIHFDQPLPRNAAIPYDLLLEDGQGIADWAPHLLYPGSQRPSFVLRERLEQLLHGSCRKPHYPAADGLLCADRLLQQCQLPEERPALLLMSGDRVYADDVAGPMLRAIHTLIERLGLFGETLKVLCRRQRCAVSSPCQLLPPRGPATRPAGQRNPARALLRRQAQTDLLQQQRRQSSGDLRRSHGHVPAGLVPVPWALVRLDMPEGLTDKRQARYRQELPQIEAFAAHLDRVARVMAHLPCLMIFDDHDITDDWNLSAQWEETAYGHPFSRRIIGNALLGYLLCQGWGNDPDSCRALIEPCKALGERSLQQCLDAQAQDTLIDQLLRFQGWQFSLATEPPLLVLDTRTRRWRSESSLKKPSGLLDWEALCELQQALLDHPSAIIVSPAPIFGVKLIETVQRVFSWLGYPLLVDAENWMAHRGAAQVILNIFSHSRTPGHYVVLSGDVHYSFVYEVLIRHRQRSPHLWQITSSGIKNQFPKRLLDVLDRLNRWLYAPRSPLNWFTKRRQMEVVPRTPSRSQAGERPWNGAGLGQVWFDEQGRPTRVFQLSAAGNEATEFTQRK